MGLLSSAKNLMPHKAFTAPQTGYNSPVVDNVRENIDPNIKTQSISTLQGTIQGTPTEDKDIVNKEYVDYSISGAAVSGAIYHDTLLNLDYASSGHTGFQEAGDYASAAHVHYLDEIENPLNSKVFTLPIDKTLTFRSNDNTPAEDTGIFNFEGIGAFSGDLVHIHQHTGNPAAGTHLLDIEAEDADVVPLSISGANATSIQTDKQVRALTFNSTQATGTAPLTIASTTLCTNLNADMLDGLHSGAFATTAYVDATAHNRLHDMTDTSDHYANPYKVFYSDGFGYVDELPLSGANTYLMSNGTSSAPSFEAVSVNNPTTMKYKLANEGRTSTTTLADDGELVFTGLEADTPYVFEGEVYIYSGNANPDVKIAMNGSGAVRYSLDCWGSAANDGTFVSLNTSTWGDALSPTFSSSPNTKAIINGSFMSPNSCSLAFQWSQRVSDGSNATYILSGSWFRVTKVDQ